MRVGRFSVCCALLMVGAWNVAVRAEDATYKVSGVSLQPHVGLMESRQTPAGPVCDKPLDLGTDHIVLTLSFSVEPQFDATHTTVTIKPSDIKIDGLPTEPAYLGTWKSVAEFSRADAVTLKQPSDWATRTSKRMNVTFHYNATKDALNQHPDVTISGQKFKLNISSNPNGFYDGSFSSGSMAYSLMSDSLPGADGKGDVTYPNGKLVVVKTGLTFMKSNDSNDPGQPVKAPLHDLFLKTTKRDKSVVAAPLIGVLNDDGKVTRVSDTMMIEGAADQKKPLTVNRLLVFGVPADAEAFQQVEICYFNTSLASGSLTLPIKLVKVEAAIDEIVTETSQKERKNTDFYMAPKFLTAPAGKKYVRVTAYCIPTPSATGEVNSSADKSAIQFSDAKGPIDGLGIWTQVGVFSAYRGVGLHSWDKYDGQTPLTFNVVYLVPADDKEFTFQMFHHQVKVPMPTATEKMDGTHLYNFQITGAKLVDAVGPYKNPQADGKVLLLSTEWTDNGRTDMNGGKMGYMQMVHTFLNVSWEGGAAPCIADVESDGKTLQGYQAAGGSVSMITSGLAKSTPSGIKNKHTFAFPVPANLTNFDLTYAGWKMASGTAAK